MATSKPVTSTSTTLNISQLGTGSGYIYVSVTRSGMTESDKVKYHFNAEPKTAKPSVYNITV
ncbi:hypothetical protein [Bacillus suaedaesalsae]|uniref:Uncharacterized protein n=1 Tax=Bacillus suaedaesalsae TaxID=2810349 RepID=A0ABS2DKU4_9BACI|nr:hypothetical protein [Bacillus suaedaesalsae]MBM6619116.1 hypothetical protein [Bacillus suaedaesalsae]